MAISYAKKLKDPRWQKKRLEILSRDNFTCQWCGDNTSTLHVHHEKYEGDPWDVDSIYLTTLCEDCHEFEHLLDKLSRFIWQALVARLKAEANGTVMGKRVIRDFIKSNKL